jgi:MEMO1 family protein
VLQSRCKFIDIALFIGFLSPGESVMKNISDIRPSPIAGKWYPADARRLGQRVDAYLADAGLPELEGEVVGVIAPHAGHQYSGPVAGYAFAALQGLQPGIIAVISPMHYPYYEPLLTTAHNAYATPLGQILVDQEAMLELNQELVTRLGFGLTAVANDAEHSLEIELPFLQRVLHHSFSLLPVMVRDQSAPVMHALGDALATVLKNRSPILVASSDLSHFYPQPVAEQLDREFLAQVQAFDPSGVLRVEAEGRGFACGHGAVAAVLWASRVLGADRVQIVKHATSGDITGDYDRVVGYAAAVIMRSRIARAQV